MQTLRKSTVLLRNKGFAAALFFVKPRCDCAAALLKIMTACAIRTPLGGFKYGVNVVCAIRTPLGGFKSDTDVACAIRSPLGGFKSGADVACAIRTLHGGFKYGVNVACIAPDTRRRRAFSLSSANLLKKTLSAIDKTCI